MKRPARLYVIIDRKTAGEADLAALAREIAAGGADIIQYRDKESADAVFAANARKIAAALEGSDALFVVNDRVRAALDCGAGGVHLGQSDCPLTDARAALGPKAVIGVTANTFEQARRAWLSGAGYIGMGAVFATSTKANPLALDLNDLARACAESPVPVFAIGGINEDNIQVLMRRRIYNVCLCSAIVAEPEKAGARTRAFRRLIDLAAGKADAA